MKNLNLNHQCDPHRRGDPCRTCESVQCAVCGGEGFLRSETVPCSGSDSCTARICLDCSEPHQCDGCGLCACDEHLAVNPRLASDGKLIMDRFCDICRRASEPCATEPDGLDDNRPVEVMA